MTHTGEPVGKSVSRVDAYEKVTGSAVFADDMQFGPGLYYGRLVRSPYAHALIKKFDASKALEMPGGSNRDPHGTYPFPGRYTGVGPGGTTDHLTAVWGVSSTCSIPASGPTPSW